MRRIVNYRIMDIFLPEADGVLVPKLVEGCDPGLVSHLRIRPGEGIVGTAAVLREPIFVPDVVEGPALPRRACPESWPRWPSPSSTATTSSAS